MKEKDLKRIWKEIRGGKYKKMANKMQANGFVGPFFHPEQIVSDDVEDVMSIPNENNTQRAIYRRTKTGTKKNWQILT